MKVITKTVTVAIVTAKVVSKEDEKLQVLVFELQKSNEKNYRKAIESKGYIVISIQHIDYKTNVYAVTYDDFMANAYACDRNGRPITKEDN